MLTHLYKHSQASNPPSTCFVTIPQSDSDKAMIAELVDQANANRAPGPQEQRLGIHGRIMVSTLATELQLKTVTSPLSKSDRVILDELSAQLSMAPNAILSSAFHVRFFQW